MKQSNRIERAKFWQEHVTKSEEGGSLAVYCQQQRISIPALKYWRRKLGAKPRYGKRVLARERSAFIPVQLTTNLSAPPQTLKLPEAKWVAELILHLGAGFGGPR